MTATPIRPAATRPLAIPIVALDVPTVIAARDLVARLGDGCMFYKVGLELFAAEGPSVVRWLREQGKEVFVDLKLHDIPNTVRGAARSVARLGASLLTVHASGGEAMVQAAVEGVREAGAHCGILGVTVLTSLDGPALDRAWGRTGSDVGREVLRLAGVTRAGGGVGIVCSGHEATAVAATFGPDFGLLIPGVRLSGGDAHDQRRVVTPAEAVAAGGRWLILGRAVTAAPDPAGALETVREELARSV